ncbi:MAG: hypothetical protein AAGG06_17330 [Pseudomonadota bacterium]
MLALGLGGVDALRTAGEDLPGRVNAVDSIAHLRQDDSIDVPVGMQRRSQWRQDGGGCGG